jgi:hypothetical protein
MQLQRRADYLPLDPYVRQRTAIYTTVAARAGTTLVASSGPDFVRLERRRFEQLVHNVPSAHFNYTPIDIPYFLGKARNMHVAGYRCVQSYQSLHVLYRCFALRPMPASGSQLQDYILCTMYQYGSCILQHDEIWSRARIRTLLGMTSATFVLCGLEHVCSGLQVWGSAAMVGKQQQEGAIRRSGCDLLLKPHTCLLGLLLCRTRSGLLLWQVR